MDNTLAQILTYLFQKEAELIQLRQEMAARIKALEEEIAKMKEPSGELATDERP